MGPGQYCFAAGDIDARTEDGSHPRFGRAGLVDEDDDGPPGFAPWWLAQPPVLPLNKEAI